MKKQILSSFIALSLAGLSGCDGGASSTDDGARSGGNTGMLTVSVTDAPVDNIEAVWVQFTAIELKPEDGPSVTITLDEPMDINLLSLQGSESQDFFNSLEFESGSYNWLRLAVNAEIDTVFDSFVELKDGSRYELGVPSGSQTGLKINSKFTVDANLSSSLVIDFDLRKSVVLNGNGEYHLKPTLRMVKKKESGSIIGSIDYALASSESCSDTDPLTGNAIYVFDGKDAATDDMDANLPEPVTTALMTFNTETGNFDYEVAYLPKGKYTVAYTCMADLDDPETDDEIIFVDVQNVKVEADDDDDDENEISR